MSKRLEGSEPLHRSGVPVGATANDFWQWSASDLLSNTLRGTLAEYIVARDLGVASGVREEWRAYDLQTPEGIKVEVKASSYWQSWGQTRPSVIEFDIARKLPWDPVTGEYGPEKVRSADVYVFCVLGEPSNEQPDPLDLDQWAFLALATEVFDRRVDNQKTIRLNPLRALSPTEVDTRGIRRAIEQVLEEVGAGPREPAQAQRRRRPASPTESSRAFVVASRRRGIATHGIVPCHQGAGIRSGGSVASLPGLVVHADWGSAPKKRWMSVAVKSGSTFRVEAPELVGELGSFWRRLLQRGGGSGALVGFDFPIGLPSAFAELAGIERFKLALSEFGKDPWAHFYTLAELPSDISIHRPFYPYRAGATKQHHLLDALGLSDMNTLRRRCDLPTSTRGAASPIFWTLGAKQVGRAAIIGWRDLLAPALIDPSIDLRIWPFDGDLTDLVHPGAVVVVETYPAEACVQLGMTPPGRGWSKTSQAGRASQAGLIKAWAGARGVRLTEQLVDSLETGFGPDPSGDDPFDAMIGLLSMLEVVLGFRKEGAPHEPAVRNVEGWILGQNS